MERQGADLETKIEELQDINQLLRNKQNEREEQINKLEESVAFLSDKFNAFLLSKNLGIRLFIMKMKGQ